MGKLEREIRCGFTRVQSDGEVGEIRCGFIVRNVMPKKMLAKKVATMCLYATSATTNFVVLVQSRIHYGDLLQLFFGTLCLFQLIMKTLNQLRVHIVGKQLLLGAYGH